MIRRARWLLPAAVGGLLLTSFETGPPGADAAFPGTNGRIAFQRGTGAGVAIFTVRPDGSDPERLTARNRVSEEPAFSPDGRRIAFARQTPDLFEQIWVMRANGGRPHRVTGTPANALNPAFSSDGGRLVFAGSDGGDPEIFTIRLDGTHLRQITDNQVDDSEPVFAPRGNRIAFVRSRPGVFGQIYTIRPDGSHLQRITHSPDRVNNQFPDFAPDGRRLVFDRRSFRPAPNGIFTIALHSGREHRLTNPPVMTTQDLEPVFAPNGRRIAFARVRNGRGRILSMRADGGSLRRLTDGDDLVPDWQPRI